VVQVYDFPPGVEAGFPPPGVEAGFPPPGVDAGVVIGAGGEDCGPFGIDDFE
jgi:hypothetical protein